MEESSSIFIIVLIVCLIFSAYFSATEIAFSSLNKIKLKNLAAGGNKRAGHALDLSEQFDRMLTTVLIGNNIVNIASSAIATMIFVAYFGNIGVTLATVVMTISVLIFGEITPKTLAREYPEKFAIFSSPFLKLLIILFRPFNAAFTAWKKLVLRLFRVENDRSISEEELLTFVEEVREEGGINEGEENMIRQAIEFDELKAGDILTPRVDVYGIPLEAEPKEITALFYDTGYSRLPVYKESLDSIQGVLLLKDYFFSLEKGFKGVEPLIRPAVFVSKNIKITALLKKLQDNQSHMAIIVDEFGGTIGIVTIEDIMEELVGDIWDEHDEIVKDICRTGEGCYEVLGGTDIGDLFDLFGLEEDEDTSSSTVGGWVGEVLGRLPEEGETLDYKGLHIIVNEIERNRIQKITVTFRNPIRGTDQETGRPSQGRS